MPGLVSISLPTEMFAHKPVWSFFTGGEPRDVDGESLLAEKAIGLAAFLEAWAYAAEKSLAHIDNAGSTSGLEMSVVPGDSKRVLTWLLASLGNAAEAVIYFKKYQQPVDVPASFLEVGYRVLERADRVGIQAGGLTVHQVARRYSAATSHLLRSPRKAKADERGFIHDDSGRRLFQFDPEGVLRGLEQIKAGHVHPPHEPRGAEERDGR